MKDDREFCTLPITFDIIDNPFRCRRNTSRGSPFLLHAMLALSLQHLNHINNVSTDDPIYTKALDHRQTSVSLFKAALGPPGSRSDIAFLDTALILCTLDVSCCFRSGDFPADFQCSCSILLWGLGYSILRPPSNF